MTSTEGGGSLVWLRNSEEASTFRIEWGVGGRNKVKEVTKWDCDELKLRSKA